MNSFAVFRESFHLRYTPLNGLLNASMAPTEYADLSYTTLAAMLSLGFIQIGQELVHNEPIEIQGIFRNRLVS